MTENLETATNKQKHVIEKMQENVKELADDIALDLEVK